MKSILCTGLICLLFLGLNAQTQVKGRVIESNGIEILGAQVTLEETQEQVITDENGWFELGSSQPLPWNLVVTYPGFSVQTIEIKKAKEVQIVMWEWERLGKQEVTAQKRQENQKEVPNFISIRQGSEISFKGQHRLDESTAHTPGIFVVGGYIQHSLNIGGIGTSPSNTGFEESIATYVDGVYYGKAIQAVTEFLDVDRVELLNGPQNLFFGQSSIGGGINITSNTPGKCNEGYINFFGGTQDEFGGEGAYTIAFTPKFRIRMAGLYKTFGGAFTDNFSLEKAGGSEAYAGRLTAVFEPSDKFELKIKGQYNQTTIGSHLQQVTTDSAGLVWKHASILPDFLQGGDIAQGDSAYTYNFEPDYILNQGASQPLPASAPFFYVRDIEQTGYLDDISTNSNSYTFSVSGDYKMKKGNVFGQLAYTAIAWDQMLDADQSKYFVYHNKAFVDNNQFSAELRYASKKSSRMNYQIGGYYQNDVLNGDNHTLTPITQWEYFWYNPFNGDILVDSLGRPIPHPLYGLGVQLAGALRGVRFKREANRTGIFGHLSYTVAPRLSVTVGGRISNELKIGNVHTIAAYSAEEMAAGMIPTRDKWEIVENLPEAYSPNLVNDLVPVEAPRLENMKLSETSVTPSVNVSYSSEKITVYAKFSQGWKAGGFNAANTIPTVNSDGFNDLDDDGIPDEAIFKPERSNAFELGFKGRWLSSAGGFLSNLSVFYNNYEQLQVNTFNAATGGFNASNAAEARKIGFLAEGKWMINSIFEIGYNASILDAKYQDYRGAVCNAGETAETIANGGTSGPCDFSSTNPITGQNTYTINRSGYPLTFAPLYYVTLSPNFNIPIGKGGFRVNLGADFSYRDEYEISDNYDVYGNQQAFFLADAWLGFVFKERLVVSFYGRNLTNEFIKDGSNESILGFSRGVRYGGQIRYNIGSCDKKEDEPAQKQLRL